MNYTNTIIELLLFALGLSLWINALHLAFGNGMILESLFKWLDKMFSNESWRKWLGKPLFLCGTCMSSIHSLPLFFILVWWKVLFICIFASVISTLIRDQLYND